MAIESLRTVLARSISRGPFDDDEWALGIVTVNSGERWLLHGICWRRLRSQVLPAMPSAEEVEELISAPQLSKVLTLLVGVASLSARAFLLGTVIAVPLRAADAAVTAAPIAAQALVASLVGDAMGILRLLSNVMTVTVATPLGLHPVVGLGCGAAATRR